MWISTRMRFLFFHGCESSEAGKRSNSCKRVPMNSTNSFFIVRFFHPSPLTSAGVRGGDNQTTKQNTNRARYCCSLEFLVLESPSTTRCDIDRADGQLG